MLGDAGLSLMREVRHCFFLSVCPTSCVGFFHHTLNKALGDRLPASKHMRRLHSGFRLRHFRRQECCTRYLGGGHIASRLEAITIWLEAIASRVEAISIRFVN